MALPLRLEVTTNETRLPAARPVSLRVLRLAASLAFARGGGNVALVIPVAVVDRGVDPPETIRVVDYTLLAAALVALLPALPLLVRLLLGKRRRRTG